MKSAGEKMVLILIVLSLGLFVIYNMTDKNQKIVIKNEADYKMNGDRQTEVDALQNKTGGSLRGSDGFNYFEFLKYNEKIPLGEVNAYENYTSQLYEDIGDMSEASDWARDLIGKGIKAGFIPNEYQSNYQAPSTRAEFLSLIVSIYELLEGEITGRTEVIDSGDEYVQKAAHIGLTQGVGDARFDPDGYITREQAAVILDRLFVALGQPLPNESPSAPLDDNMKITFADNDSISDWARSGVERVRAAGIMRGVGDNRFGPKDICTREQCILAAVRALTLLGHNA